MPAPERKIDFSKGKLLLFSFVIPVLCFSACEAVLLLSGMEFDIFSAPVYFGPETPFVFADDPELRWLFRPGLDMRFQGSRLITTHFGLRSIGTGDETLREDPGSEDARILFLGDSSTFGWRVDGGTAFPGLVSRNAASEFSGFEPGVINGGVPGYTSAQGLILLRRISRKTDLDYVFIYLSNNELWSAANRDRLILPVTEGWRNSLHLRLWKLKSFRAARKLLLTLRGKNEGPVGIAERKGLPEGNSSPHGRKPDDGADEISSVRVPLEDYRENMTQLIENVRGIGAVPIILTVPVNIYSPPVVKAMPVSREAAEALEAARKLYESWDLDKALDLYTEAARLEPESVLAHYNAGMILHAMKRPGAAEKALETALEVNTKSYRLKRGYNLLLKELSANMDVELIDLAAMFRKYPADMVFLDHCHPTLFGHRLIAGEVIDFIERNVKSHR